MIGVADTGFVLAAVNHADKHHAACARTYQAMRRIHLPQSVLTEAAYMIMRDAGVPVAVRFLMNLHTTKYRLLALELADIRRAASLLDHYANIELDFVDASVVAVAERLNLIHILTIDKRDFNIIRPLHAEFFTLLPEEA